MGAERARLARTQQATAADGTSRQTTALRALRHRGDRARGDDLALLSVEILKGVKKEQKTRGPKKGGKEGSHQHNL